MTCNLCHEDSPLLGGRQNRALCPDCISGWDYWHSLTPAERRAEEESIARHCASNAVE